jgi:hypothetical protein
MQSDVPAADRAPEPASGITCAARPAFRGATHRRTGCYPSAPALWRGSPFVRLSLSNLASQHEALGQYDHVEPLYMRAIQILMKADDPAVLAVVNNLASLTLLWATTVLRSRS